MSGKWWGVDWVIGNSNYKFTKGHLQLNPLYKVPILKLGKSIADGEYDGCTNIFFLWIRSISILKLLKSNSMVLCEWIELKSWYSVKDLSLGRRFELCTYCKNCTKLDFGWKIGAGRVKCWYWTNCWLKKEVVLYFQYTESSKFYGWVNSLKFKMLH